MGASPDKFLYLGKMSNFPLIDQFKSTAAPVNVIYSQWLGYLDGHHAGYFGSDQIAALRQDPAVNFIYAHTSASRWGSACCRPGPATEIGTRKVTIYPNWVAADFFQTMEVPLRLGRTFHPGEKHVVIVSESFARQQWPGKNPVGETVGAAPNRDTLIGVVGDAHINALSDDDALEQYWAAQPDNLPNMVVVVRAAGEPEQIGPAAKAIATSLDASVFPEIRQVKALVRENHRIIEDVAGIVSLVGLVALSLAVIGLVGLVAFVMTQRTKEIAIRMAVGGRPLAVLSAVLRQFRWPVALGAAIGTGLAAFGSSLLRVALYGVNNLDPISYTGALSLLLLIAITSMILPAVRTLRMDLAAILHYE
jgi:hypothetical protein